jgi:HK97 family phage portal protein
LKEGQQGTENARDIMLLGGGLKWQQMAMSPQDMDWLQGTKMLAQEIASVFRVPTQLLGIEGSQTYANYEEAKLAFWLQAVLPKLDLYVNELNRWLAPEFGDNVKICYNKESIEALEPLRREKRRELLETSVLTINEKRELLSYEEMDEDEASTLFIQPNDIPLGADFLDEEDQTLQQAAKALMKLEGLDYKDAYQRAFELRQDADESEL